MQEYPAGAIEVRGTRYPVTVSDSGYWSATIEGDREYASLTKEELRKSVMAGTLRKRAVIDVPFRVLDHDRTAGWQVRHGTVTGKHAGTGQYLVTWANGRKTQEDFRYGTATLRPLSGGEEARWIELAEASRLAAKALKAFEGEHGFTLSKEVGEAIEAGVRQAAGHG